VVMGVEDNGSEYEITIVGDNFLKEATFFQERKSKVIMPVDLKDFLVIGEKVDQHLQKDGKGKGKIQHERHPDVPLNVVAKFPQENIIIFHQP
jgi:hypothetical protein